MPTDSYGQPGTYTFTVPNNVNTLTVELSGAGSGFGGDGNNPDNIRSLGLGGNGGGAVQFDVDVTPGEDLTVYVGERGGTGGNTGGNGGYGGSGYASGNAGTDAAVGEGAGGGGAGSSALTRSDGTLLAEGGGGGGGGGGAGEFVDGKRGGDGGGAQNTGGTGGEGSHADEDGAYTFGTSGSTYTSSQVYNTGYATNVGQEQDGYVDISYTVLTAPSSLSVSTSSRQASLSWSEGSGEDGYRIYRATSSGSSAADYTEVATVGNTTTSYTDTGLLDGEKYYYRVAGYTTSDEKLSNEASGTTPLPAPSGLTLDTQ